MIKIERIPKPAILDSEKVIKETKEAINLFRPDQNVTDHLIKKRKKFSYDQYRNAEIKDALKRMCHDKCAYCESNFLHVYYGDIEHFRPKKMVGTKAEPKVPGYYWLANDWNNLLLSCLFCNQAKKQFVQKDNSFQIVTIGKQNRFPLSKKRLYNRTRTHKDWNVKEKKENENRLIIDPCKDEPERYFKYEKEGIILPKYKTGKKNKIAEESINIFALQRFYLVQERRKKSIEIAMQIDLIKDYILKLNSNISNPVIDAHFESKIKDGTDKLFHFTYKRAPFSAMARQFVYAFLEEDLKLTDQKIIKREKHVHEQLDANFKQTLNPARAPEDQNPPTGGQRIGDPSPQPSSQ